MLGSIRESLYSDPCARPASSVSASPARAIDANSAAEKVLIDLPQSAAPIRDGFSTALSAAS